MVANGHITKACLVIRSDKFNVLNEILIEIAMVTKKILIKNVPVIRPQGIMLLICKHL